MEIEKDDIIETLREKREKNLHHPAEGHWKGEGTKKKGEGFFPRGKRLTSKVEER